MFDFVLSEAQQLFADRHYVATSLKIAFAQMRVGRSLDRRPPRPSGRGDDVTGDRGGRREH